jgi:hypothetical protein
MFENGGNVDTSTGTGWVTAAPAAPAQEDARRVQAAQERVAQCMRRLVDAALVLDRMLVERGDEDERRLVEGALRLTANV